MPSEKNPTPVRTSRDHRQNGQNPLAPAVHVYTRIIIRSRLTTRHVVQVWHRGVWFETSTHAASHLRIRHSTAPPTSQKNAVHVHGVLGHWQCVRSWLLCAACTVQLHLASLSQPPAPHHTHNPFSALGRHRCKASPTRPSRLGRSCVAVLRVAHGRPSNPGTKALGGSGVCPT